MARINEHLRILHRESKKAGLSPGSLVYVGEKKTEPVTLSLIDYDKVTFEERTVDRVEDCFPFRDTSTVSWINVNGIHDAAVVEQLCTHFGIHPLVQEDIMNTAHRTKLEEYDDYFFIILKMMRYDDAARQLSSEQVSIIIGPHFIISFQERPGDVFDAIRKRVRNQKGRHRKAGPDYLAYTLIDAIIDNYFIVLERLSDDIETLEEELIDGQDDGVLQRLQVLRKDVLYLRRAIWPLRESISTLLRTDSALVKKSTLPYFRDIHDHTIQAIDSIETFRDVLAGLLDLYMSSVSNRMNEVMKVLTIVATIFIPLTFVAGIYGMNFAHMPELGLSWGYPAVLIGMAFMGLGMVVYFRRKKWL